MKTMTASDVRAMLIDLHGVNDFVASFNGEWPKSSALAQERIRNIEGRLLRLSLADVAVEPSAPEREQVMGEAA